MFIQVFRFKFPLFCNIDLSYDLRVEDMWSIWMHRKEVLFKGVGRNSETVFVLIKFRSWSWYKARSKGAAVSFYDWSQHLQSMQQHLAL